MEQHQVNKNLKYIPTFKTPLKQLQFVLTMSEMPLSALLQWVTYADSSSNSK